MLEKSGGKSFLSERLRYRENRAILSNRKRGDTSMSVEEIVSAIVEAHGGRVLWEQTETLEAEISASGFLFTAKGPRSSVSMETSGS
jgi:hypothetical protein